MTKEEIKRLIVYVQDRVTLSGGADEISIDFAEPSEAHLRAEGFDDEMIGLTLGRDWWSEMATDIVETPEFAEPDESPEQVLQYARDVVSEYVRKRLNP